MERFIIRCPDCDHTVNSHCDNPTCDWWTCPQCHLVGDSHGHTYRTMDQP